MDWADEIISKQGDEQAERQWESLKAAGTQDRLNSLFSQLKKTAKDAIAKFRTIPKYSELWFEDENVGAFTVKNLVYPTVTISVRAGIACIAFETATRAKSRKTQESDHIDAVLDRNFVLSLSHHGKRLGGIDEALALILRPAVEHI